MGNLIGGHLHLGMDVLLHLLCLLLLCLPGTWAGQRCNLQGLPACRVMQLTCRQGDLGPAHPGVLQPGRSSEHGAQDC